MATSPQNSAYTMSNMSVQAPAFNPMFTDSNAPPPPPAPIAIDVATVPLQQAALQQSQEPVSSGPWSSQAPMYGSYGLPPPPLHSAPPAYGMPPFVPEFRPVPAQAPQPRTSRGIESTHPRDKGFVCAIYRSQKQCPVSNCPYAHIQDGTTKPLPLTPCNFFQTSRCLRDGCAFFHGLATTLSAVRASGVTTYCPLDYMPTRDPLSELSEAELQLTAGQVCARSSGMVLPGSSQSTASSTASALRPPPAAPTPMWPPPPFFYPTPPGPASPHHPAYPPNPYVVSSTAVNVPPNAMLPSPYPPPPMYSGHTHHHHHHHHQHQHQQQHHHHQHHHQHHYGGGNVPAPAYNYYPTAPPPFPPSA